MRVAEAGVVRAHRKMSVKAPPPKAIRARVKPISKKVFSLQQVPMLICVALPGPVSTPQPDQLFRMVKGPS